MSSDLIVTVLPTVVLTGITDVFSLYSAYLSLSVRRGLAVPVYKSRALWMALLGVSAAIVFTYDGLAVVFPTSSLASVETREILFAIPLGVILVLIDRTVNTVIKLDYLRRDVLHWKKLRFVFGAVVVLFYILYYSRYVYFLPDAQGFALAMYFPALAYGALAIAKGTTLTRDLTFRSHVRWFAYLLLMFIAANVLYFLPIPLAVDYFFFTLAAFCVYKMSRFLVPTGKLSTQTPISA